MVIIQDMHIVSVPERIIQMHSPTADDAENLTQSMMNKKICYIIRYLLFHRNSSLILTYHKRRYTIPSISKPSAPFSADGFTPVYDNNRSCHERGIIGQ